LLQVTASVVAVYNNYWNACAGEQLRDGLFRPSTLRDAVLRSSEHCLLPLEDEQSSRHHHVPLLLCIRRRFTWF